MIRCLYRRLAMGKEKFRKRVGIAFHESGHSVMGYYHGHPTNFIDINLDAKNQIYPQVDKIFGTDEQIISEIHNGNVAALNQRMQSDVIEVAEKYCEGLLAGTMAEYWYLYNGQPTFNQINRNDKDKVTYCINVLHQVIGQHFDRNSFLNERLNITRDFICNDVNFIKIKKIADALIKSRGLRIEREEVEEIINNQ